MKNIKELIEINCARKFINEYNRRNTAKYKIKRTEALFPLLANQDRWDFVAIEKPNASDWIAIEIKQLTRKEVERQLSDWQKLVKKVKEELLIQNAKAIKGTYVILPSAQPVLYEMGGDKTKRLKNALKKLLPSIILTMKNGDFCDIGPDIIKTFPDWPFTPDLQTKPTIEMVKKAQEMYLFKTSSRGRNIEVLSMGEAFTTKEATSRALLNITTNEGEITKACQQLSLAKEMGASKTIFLLDYYLPVRTDINLIKQIMFKDQRSLKDVDETYLIDTRKNTVTRIHP